MEKQVGAENVAAAVIEPIQGEGGFVVPAPGFLPALSALVHATHGALFIADEVQTGFCRTGDWFASEHESVVPDLITTAKGIAGGLPLAGVTGRAEIMDAVHTGGLGGTYGGNPVACAAASRRDRDDARAGSLRRAARRHRVGDAAAADRTGQGPSTRSASVRGRGAMIAIELVEPVAARRAGWADTDAAAAQAIAQACHAAGLLVLTCGTYGNVLRFLPPLVIDDDTLHRGLDI